MAVTKVSGVDMNGLELVLDADADTTITADTDDQIDIKIAGADDFQFTANTFTAQSGSTIAAQALTATTGVFSSTIQGTTITATTAVVPDASDGAALGTTSLEWSDLYLADGAVLGFGDDQDVTLTHVADTGILLNSTMAIQFNDSSQYINAPSNAILDINATDEIELNATAVDLNGTLDVSGTLTQTGIATFAARPVFQASITIQDGGSIGSASDPNAVTISSGGVVAVTATTASTNSTSGALTVAGGAGVAADLGVGDDLRLISDSAVLSFGADSDVTLTHAADASLTLAGGTVAQLIMSTGSILPSTDTDTSNTGSVTLNFQTKQNFVLTFTGNVTLANPTTETAGQSGVIVCIQDGTGSRTLSLGTDYETAGGAGITLSTAASAVDVIPYFVKAAGSIQLGAVQKAFS